MKLGSIMIGIMMLIGGVGEYYSAPIMIHMLNNLTDNIETGMMVPISHSNTTLSNSGYQEMNQMLANANREANQAMAGFTSIELKLIHYTSYAFIIFGVIFIVYGSLSKSKIQVIKLKSNDAFDLLKMRLAKGEIDEDQFKKLKKNL
jgi:uncharacterized membrane protein